MKIVIIGALILSAILIFTKSRPSVPVATLILTPSPNPSPAPVRTEKAVLKDVSGGYAVGLATKTAIGNEFVFSVSAQLSAPAEGKFYEAWLVRLPEPDTIPIGKLANSEAEHVWGTTLRTSSGYSEYREVSITLEKEDDNTSEKTILRGTLAEEK